MTILLDELDDRDKRNLALGVIRQAYFDICTYQRNNKNKEGREALAWVMSGDKDFESWCQTIDLNPEIIRKALHKCSQDGPESKEMRDRIRFALSNPPKRFAEQSDTPDESPDLL